MTKEQKEYIEKNIHLIESKYWDKFFENAPSGIGEPLYISEVDFMTELGYVPRFAFSYCKSLTSMELSPSITYIDDEAFRDCYSLTNVTIPNSVIHIGRKAFLGCSKLTQVNIPISVRRIDYGAFTWCALLTSINFDGKIAQWNEIEKVGAIDRNIVINCIDGQIVTE